MVKDFTNTLEILDLESATGVCDDLTPFRTAVLFAFGVLGQDKMPIICGGYIRAEESPSKDCHR